MEDCSTHGCGCYAHKAYSILCLPGATDVAWWGQLPVCGGGGVWHRQLLHAQDDSRRCADNGLCKHLSSKYIQTLLLLQFKYC